MRAFFLLLACTSVAALRRHSKQKSDLIFHRRREPAYQRLGWKQHFQQYTSALSVTKNPMGMVAKCKPVLEEPRGESRGVILLQHGYTGCPGFWYLMVPRLVQAGWTVLAPILPGHGRAPLVTPNSSSSYEVRDYLDELPTSGDDFEGYSRELIEIARKYKAENANKEMVLVGVSFGGAVATFMAMNGEAGTWDRLMLMQPFLAPPEQLGDDFTPSSLRRILAVTLPAFKLLTNDTMTWGAECEEARWPADPRKGGHGGNCQYTLSNAAAVLGFGNLVEAEARTRAAKSGMFIGGVVDRAEGLKELLKHKAWQLVSGGGDPPPTKPKIQLLATSFDDALSNPRVHFLAKALAASTMSDHSAYCALDREFNHTFINPIDKTFDADLWWLDASRVEGGRSILDMLEAFASEGIVFPTDGTIQDDEALKGDPRCAVSKRGR